MGIAIYTHSAFVDKDRENKELRKEDGGREERSLLKS